MDIVDSYGYGYIITNTCLIIPLLIYNYKMYTMERIIVTLVMLYCITYDLDIVNRSINMIFVSTIIYRTIKDISITCIILSTYIMSTYGMETGIYIIVIMTAIYHTDNVSSFNITYVMALIKELPYAILIAFIYTIFKILYHGN